MGVGVLLLCNGADGPQKFFNGGVVKDKPLNAAADERQQFLL